MIRYLALTVYRLITRYRNEGLLQLIDEVSWQLNLSLLLIKEYVYFSYSFYIGTYREYSVYGSMSIVVQKQFFFVSLWFCYNKTIPFNLKLKWFSLMYFYNFYSNVEFLLYRGVHQHRDRLFYFVCGYEPLIVIRPYYWSILRNSLP